MKRPTVTAEIEVVEPETSDDAPRPARPQLTTPGRQRLVALRGRVIRNPDDLAPPRFALREDDGTTIGLYGVYADEDAWLLGARVEVEGQYVSESIVSVTKLVLRTQ